jgi:hypothetical protein
MKAEKHVIKTQTKKATTLRSNQSASSVNSVDEVSSCVESVRSKRSNATVKHIEK